MLPIRYQDGSVDFAVSVPLWYKEAAKDLLSRIAHQKEWAPETIGWAKDVCSEVIVQNRRKRGIDFEKIERSHLDSLFFGNGNNTLLYQIVANETMVSPPEYLVSKQKIEVSELPIANVYSLLLQDKRLSQIWTSLIELDAGTMFASVYHLWVRSEDPEKRKDREVMKRYLSKEYQESQEGRQLEALYQSRVEATMTRIKARQINDTKQQPQP